MRRTTIFLPDSLHDRLRSEAFAARVSMAELIRQRVDRGGPRVKRSIDPLAKVEGIIRDGRLSEGIDEELYSK